MTVDDNSTRRLPPIPRLMRCILLSFLPLACSVTAFAADAQVPAPDGCSPPIVADTTGGSGVYPNGDAADVYRTVLDLFFVDGDESPSIIVMHDRAENPSEATQYCGAVCNPWTHKSKIDTATLVAFRQHSRERPRITPFGYRIPIVFMSYDDRARMAAQGCTHLEKRTPSRPAGIDPFLSEFTRRYPDAWGTLLLTKVGFDPSRDEALVEASFNCGETCFSVEILFLRKIDRQWVVVERIPIYGEVPGMWFRGLRYRGPAGSKSAESELLISPAEAGAARVRREANDAATVYRAVLDSLYNFHGDSPRRIVVTDWFYPDTSALPAKLGEIDPSTLERYRFLRTVHARPYEHLHLLAPISLLPRDSTPMLQRVGQPLAKKAEDEGEGVDEATPFWLAFRELYPGAWGTVAFSPAAFNPEHTQALVFTNHACGERCHNGDTWLLERTGENWRIVERIPRAKETVWGLDSLRYLGVDASSLAYRPRRIHGTLTLAATAHALPGLTVMVHRGSRSSHVSTDLKGRYSVDSLPINARTLLTVACPSPSRRAPLVLAMFQARGGLDSTMNVAVDFRRCLHDRPARALAGEIPPWPDALKSTYPDAQVASVYRGILDALYPAGGATKGPILLHPITNRFSIMDLADEMPRLIRLGLVDSSMETSIDKVPPDSVWLRPKFEYSRRVIILEPSAKRFLFAQGDDFLAVDPRRDVSLTTLAKQAYPGADRILSFSRVAFNSARTQALVQVSAGDDPGYGRTETMALHEAGAGWRVVRRHVELGKTSGERVGDRCEPTDAPTTMPTKEQIATLIGDADITVVPTSRWWRKYAGTSHYRLGPIDTLRLFHWLPPDGDLRGPVSIHRRRLALVQFIDSTGKRGRGRTGSLDFDGGSARVTFVADSDRWAEPKEEFNILEVRGREFFGSWLSRSSGGDVTMGLKGYFCGRLR
ncbi:MAG: hypothetical protein M3Z54_11385 [Gemmatimonadota bacterium]|nr:hypothetical protein [Gemmatimonadota bacterium]